jgi:hypothetical protein
MKDITNKLETNKIKLDIILIILIQSTKICTHLFIIHLENG